ncbi:NACHT domain-containing protein [Streptomyces sp. ID05-26A]|nr:NACHT domain-containing protein [Streptomyces sp. ID05-26A]
MKHPPITFQGALQILGQHERPWLEKVNRAAGGIILATGFIPASIAISSIWGWIDQKNEGTSLLRSGLDGAARRLTDTVGLERNQLVIAAHTALAMSAFFEAVADSPLGRLYAEAAVSDRYKLQLAGADEDLVDSTVRALYKVNVPAPTAVVGFVENADRLLTWAEDMYLRTAAFVRLVLDDPITLEAWQSIGGAQRAAGQAMVDKYQSHYYEFSAKIPEFAVWSNSLEHAATRSAMGGLEQLLSQIAGSTTEIRDMRSVVREVNVGVLRDPVLDLHTDGYGFDTPFPSAEALFVKPDCRVATSGSSATISSEDWWQRQKVEKDLCLVLARHFTSADATVLPLLLLGHPGAGKSLVTKMIAARLPDSQYTVVRVPLRHVDANALLTDQVQQALDQSTHGRVQWSDLVDQSTEVTKVLLLDGLDELLQASTGERTDYLVRISEFQRREADMGHPLAVIVTSRTLVADRVTVPRNTPVVKLEEFNDDQIREWVRNWNDSNTSDRLPEMSISWALTHRHLASQPLLLLMLTLYRAHRGAEAEVELSPTDLYERLFNDFARREISKREGKPLQGDEVEDAVHLQLRTLAIAALGMFNRGRQDIIEQELGADLKSLEGPTTSGKRLLAEFFFIHSPEARASATVRSYEFLHATFAEYLVADRIVDVLRDVTESAFGRRARRTPEDDLLFALLSHQPLAIQQPVLEFVHEKLAKLDADELDHVRQTLDILLDGYRRRLPSRRFGDYRPTPFDSMRSTAAYAANLVLLRIQYPLSGTGAPLEDVFSDEDPLPPWRATVDMWKAFLDEAGYNAMLGAVDLVDGRTIARVGLTGSVPELHAFHHARLQDDRDTLSILRTGAVVTRSIAYLRMRGSAQSRADEWYEHVSAWLHASASAEHLVSPRIAITDMPCEVSLENRADIAQRATAIVHESDSIVNNTAAMLWLAQQLGVPGESITRAVVERASVGSDLKVRENITESAQQSRITIAVSPSSKWLRRGGGNELDELLLSPRSHRKTSHHFVKPAIKLADIGRTAVYYCVSFDDSNAEVKVQQLEFFGGSGTTAARDLGRLKELWEPTGSGIDPHVTTPGTAHPEVLPEDAGSPPD